MRIYVRALYRLVTGCRCIYIKLHVFSFVPPYLFGLVRYWRRIAGAVAGSPHVVGVVTATLQKAILDYVVNQVDGAPHVTENGVAVLAWWSTLGMSQTRLKKKRHKIYNRSIIGLVLWAIKRDVFRSLLESNLTSIKFPQVTFITFVMFMKAI